VGEIDLQEGIDRPDGGDVARMFRVVAELPLSTGAMFWHMIRRAG
jgi:hypothetical protein